MKAESQCSRSWCCSTQRFGSTPGAMLVSPLIAALRSIPLACEDLPVQGGRATSSSRPAHVARCLVSRAAALDATPGHPVTPRGDTKRTIHLRRVLLSASASNSLSQPPGENALHIPSRCVPRAAQVAEKRRATWTPQALWARVSREAPFC